MPRERTSAVNDRPRCIPQWTRPTSSMSCAHTRPESRTGIARAMLGSGQHKLNACIGSLWQVRLIHHHLTARGKELKCINWPAHGGDCHIFVAYMFIRSWLLNLTKLATGPVTGTRTKETMCGIESSMRLIETGLSTVSCGKLTMSDSRPSIRAVSDEGSSLSESIYVTSSFVIRHDSFFVEGWGDDRILA